MSAKIKGILEAEYLSTFESEDPMERSMADHVKARLEGKKCYRGRLEEQGKEDIDDGGCIACSG